MRPFYILLLLLGVLVVVSILFMKSRRFPLPSGETMVIETPTGTADAPVVSDGTSDGISPSPTVDTNIISSNTGASRGLSERQILVTDGVKHSIPIDEIRQGCFGRDCIPSVDDPAFITANEADDVLPDDTVGIGLVHKGEKRFYPFNMLVTREIVNDTVSGDPLAVTYCPLCGTGVVFRREVSGKIFEFGVSGMLWQSNLLMYNREPNEEMVSLWSQVLGEAVLGTFTGTRLPLVPSDIVRYTDWRTKHPGTQVLNTGRIGDPYGGDYYSVARSFRPNFNEENSVLSPTAQVSGVDIDGQFKAYLNNALVVGTTVDTFANRTITIEKSSIGELRMFTGAEKTPLPYISGFWFSWVAVHPETEVYQ
jgi:hypothetical protein